MPSFARMTPGILAGSTAVFLLLTGCGSSLPQEIHTKVFEGSGFSKPMPLEIGETISTKTFSALKANAQPADNSLFPAIIHYKPSWSLLPQDSHLMNFLVVKGYLGVNKLSVTNRFGTTTSYFSIETDKTELLKKAAQRKLKRVDFINKYDDTVSFGTKVKVIAFTFVYRLVPLIPDLPGVERDFKGKGKAHLNPDTGEWECERLQLEDRGMEEFVALIQKQYPPFNLASVK